MSTTDACPVYAPFFGFSGVAAAMVFSSMGAAYGTAKSGIGIAGVGPFRPDLIMKSLIPVVMSGIIAVYGLVISVLIAGDLSPTQNYSLFNGFLHLACGLCVGLTGLAAGYAIGIVGDAGVRMYMQQSRIFVAMVLVLIFAEVLGLYGLIVGMDTDMDLETLNSTPLSEVRVQALVALKIIKHCRDFFPASVQGHLVGISGNSNAGVLEVTNAFPVAASDDALDPSKNRVVATWLKQLHEVDVDDNSVGWYTSGYLGSFLNSRVVLGQVLHQKNLTDRSILLVHDLSRSNKDALPLHAYRLTQTFIAAYKDGKFTAETLAKRNLLHNDILEEIPITIEQSHLQSAILQCIPDTSQIESRPTYEALDVTVDPYLEKVMEYLIAEIDDWKDEQGNLGYHQRQSAREWARIHAWQTKRKIENSDRVARGEEPLREDEWTRIFKLPAEPNRYETLLLNSQIDQYCKQIDTYAGVTIPKMYALRDGFAGATARSLES